MSRVPTQCLANSRWRMRVREHPGVLRDAAAYFEGVSIGLLAVGCERVDSSTICS